MPKSSVQPIYDFCILADRDILQKLAVSAYQLFQHADIILAGAETAGSRKAPIIGRLHYLKEDAVTHNQLESVKRTNSSIELSCGSILRLRSSAAVEF